LPTLMVAGLDILKVVMVPYGSMAGLGQITGACILVQLPFCMLNGFLFSFLSISPADNFWRKLMPGNLWEAWHQAPS